MKCVKYTKVCFKKKENLISVNSWFQPIWTFFDNIRKTKNNFPRLHSRTCFCCYYGILKSNNLRGKSKCFAAWFHYITIAFNLAYNRNKQYKTLNYWSRDVLNFDFLKEGLGIVSPPHFVYDFSRKIFLMLHSINWPSFIAWLPLLLDILGNMWIAIVF